MASTRSSIATALIVAGLAHPCRSFALAFSSPHAQLAPRPPRHVLFAQAAAATTDGDANAGSDTRTASPATTATFFDELSARFQGDFDNYDQVLSDRRSNLFPRDGGGHEHIHCTLVPVDHQSVRPFVRDDTRQARLAAFYFDGLPDRIFRFRLYSLWRHDDGVGGESAASADNDQDTNENVDDTAKEMCGMTLYSLCPQTEGMLRGLSGRPTEWGPALTEYLQSLRLDGAAGDNGNKEKEQTQTQTQTQPSVQSPQSQPFKELRGCDVEWTADPDPDRHAYAYGTSSRLHPDDAHHAVMVNGEATMPSMMNPGSWIRVVDELSLWSDDFWINDRGFDPDSGCFIYGNQRGVPYKMKRITSLSMAGSGEEQQQHQQEQQQGKKQERRIVNDEMAWTLGEEFRSKALYEDKMAAIGGMSTILNAGARSGAAASSPQGTKKPT